MEQTQTWTQARPHDWMIPMETGMCTNIELRPQVNSSINCRQLDPKLGYFGTQTTVSGPHHCLSTS